ncbi:MAG TPA: tetratricopeptide repeat protein [Gemmatimonadaceae bacterium]|nr:tetratricopeptide repeat protein [Gemmatimonadaceae bacterium]
MFGIMACGEKPVVETVPLRPELAGFRRQITTKSAPAQKYFDQGFTLYYGFNHDAAIASFAQAAAFDPNCAMAYWGQAASWGPNINNPAMDDSASKRAWDALQKAASFSASAAPVERDLIAALATRYAWPAPADRTGLDRAYADAMRQVWQKYPEDPDVGALCAEAIMDTRPWDLWSPTGEPRPETPEVIATLDKVIALVPDHPGASHFYIHTMEASPTPEKALPAANVLRDRIPGAGHLVHMPAHIDIRLGHYDDALVANQKGIAADATWAAQQGGFYTMYRAHNHHFLAYAAMFEGRREVALQAASAMLEQVPLAIVRQYIDVLDGFWAAPTHVQVRFGMWNELLAAPAPPADLLVATAFWHYGRTVAAAALGRVDEAATELAAFQQAYAAVPGSRFIGNNAARTVLEIGLPVAEGELEYRRGNFDHAFELLRLAVQRDDALRYDEPWGWTMPVRHSLGALLLEQGRVDEAERVYREDLRLHPDNGWALHGLAECLRRSGRAAEAADVETRFRGAWTRSDIAIQGSCFCRTKS